MVTVGRDVHRPLSGKSARRHSFDPTSGPLQGEGPEIVPYRERTAIVTVNKLAEAGRFLNVTADDGRRLHLRAAGDVDFEGIKDRSEPKVGMRLKVTCLEPA
jgi:hypothetical protein